MSSILLPAGWVFRFRNVRLNVIGAWLGKNCDVYKRLSVICQPTTEDCVIKISEGWVFLFMRRQGLRCSRSNVNAGDCDDTAYKGIISLGTSTAGTTRTKGHLE